MAIKHTKTAIPDVDKVDCTDWNANHIGTLDHGTELTNVTTDQHHAQSHAHDGIDGSGTVAHSDTTGKTADDHHAQVHTIVSHDTTATGAELDTLTDNSMADALHRHSELSASDGTPDQAVFVDNIGNVGIGTTTPTQPIHISKVGDTPIRFETRDVEGAPTSEGPNNPGTMADDASVGTVIWDNPDNAKISDDSYASTYCLEGGP